jgi:DNA-directed RNA polymerase specialized sigma24 family protein
MVVDAGREVGADFEECFRERRIGLFRFAPMLTGDPALGDELVTALLGTAFERGRRPQRPTTCTPYVRRMVVNEYFGWRRRRS